MTEYRVRRFGDRSQQGCLSVLAETAEEAASKVCGAQVTDHGKRACAEVYPVGGSPRDLMTFYPG